MRLSIPDFSERRRFEESLAELRKDRGRIERIKHSCGHEQGHVVAKGSDFLAADYPGVDLAEMTRKELRAQPCGACGGEFPSHENAVEAQDLEEALEFNLTPGGEPDLDCSSCRPGECHCEARS